MHSHVQSLWTSDYSKGMMPDFRGNIYTFTKSSTLHQIYFQPTVPPEGLGYFFGPSVLVNHRVI